MRGEGRAENGNGGERCTVTYGGLGAVMGETAVGGLWVVTGEDRARQRWERCAATGGPCGVTGAVRAP